MAESHSHSLLRLRPLFPRAAWLERGGTPFPPRSTPDHNWPNFFMLTSLKWKDYSENGQQSRMFGYIRYTRSIKVGRAQVRCDPGNAGLTGRKELRLLGAGLGRLSHWEGGQQSSHQVFPFAGSNDLIPKCNFQGAPMQISRTAVLSLSPYMVQSLNRDGDSSECNAAQLILQLALSLPKLCLPTPVSSDVSAEPITKR